MTQTRLEHLNVTVNDPDAFADMLCTIFDWRIRWQGASLNNGHSVHVGTDDSYVALYRAPGEQTPAVDSYTRAAGLNHIGVVVDDLAATEERVRRAGFRPHSHADYEPGERFYFDAPDGVEIEVVSYAKDS